MNIDKQLKKYTHIHTNALTKSHKHTFTKQNKKKYFHNSMNLQIQLNKKSFFINYTRNKFIIFLYFRFENLMKIFAFKPNCLFNSIKHLEQIKN